MNSSAPTLDPAAEADAPLNQNRGARLDPKDAPPRSSVLRPRNLILAFVGLAVLIWGIRFALHAYRYETTDDAYVTGHLHRISAQVSGLVKEIRVQENQVVAAGDVLVVLDPQEFQIAVEKARAAVAQAHAQEAQAAAATEQAEAQFSVAQARQTQAESQLKQVNAQLELARLTLARTEQLFNNDSGAATRADLDTARSAFDSAQASAGAAESNIAAAKAEVNAASASRDAAHAQATAAQASVAAAEAAVRDAELQLSYTQIVAPVAGRIGNKAVESGNRIQAGQTLFALAAPEMWVTANFKETQLAHMHTGQTVELTIDALPGETVQGHIESVSPASGAQFALLPPDNATGNFNKVVQRVPVKIVFEPDVLQRLGDRLRLGLSAIPEVRIR